MPKVRNTATNQSSKTRTSLLQQGLEAIWYDNAPGKQLLYPLEFLYKLAARIDRYFKSRQAIKHPIPVIVVGNISVGGTGKTPLVIYLCELLKQAGYSPGIITRGYGGKHKGWPSVVDAKSDPAEYGDEPVLMAQRTGVPIIAGPNRNEDVTCLLSKYSDDTIDVIISDDGLQHHQLARDIEIVVIDAARGLGNQRCLPAGPLRESPVRLQQVDFVVSNEQHLSTDYSMQLTAQSVSHLKSAIQQPLSDWKGKKVHAVTGIGNPSRFFDLLIAAGLQVKAHRFPDHYAFKAADLVFNDEWPVVMTEKDAVKCAQFAEDHHWCVPVTAMLTEQFDQALLKKLAAVAVERVTQSNA